MSKRRVWRWSLGVAGSIVALMLIVWLVFGLISRTTLTADLEDQKVAAETQLGNLKCRKTLTTTFPFLVLHCQDTSEHP